MRGLLGLVVLVGLPTGLSAAEPTFQTDVGTLIDADGITRTHLIFSFSPVSTDLLVDIRFKGDGGFDLERNWVVSPGDLDQGPGRARTWGQAFEFPPGEVRARITVQDLEEAVTAEASIRFEVPTGEGSALQLSDIFFGTCRDDETEGEPPWSRLIPNPGRVFGRTVPTLCLFVRVTDDGAADPASVYDFHIRIQNDRGKTLADDRVEVPRRDGSGDLLYRPRIDTLTRGRYEVRLEGALGKNRVETEGWFVMDDSRLSIYGDPEKIRGVLEYVATNEELLALEATPDESLPGFWDTFWERRDPISETEANESMVEFLERVDIATRRFGTLDPGWQTDRGRVYIQLGSPDREEQLGGDPSSLVWYYDDRNLSFVFQDIDGFGRYRLVGRRRP